MFFLTQIKLFMVSGSSVFKLFYLKKKLLHVLHLRDYIITYEAELVFNPQH